MSIISKIKSSTAPTHSLLEVPFRFDGDEEETVLTFRIRSLSLGEVMSATKAYPRLYALIEGAKQAEELESLSVIEQVEKATEFVGAFEELVRMAAELQDGEEWVPVTGEALSPEDLPAEVIISVGQGIISRFRLAVR